MILKFVLYFVVFRRVSPCFAVFRRISGYFAVFRRISPCFAVFRRILGVYTDRLSDSMAAILKNRYDVITSPPIVRLRRNLTGWWQWSDCYQIWPMDAKWHPDNYTQVKIETRSTIPICVGGLAFSEPGSSFTSAVHWNTSSKFGKQIVIHLLKQVPSLNLNPEVDFWLHGRHLEKSIWRHNPAMGIQVKSVRSEFGDNITRWQVISVTEFNSNVKC